MNSFDNCVIYKYFGKAMDLEYMPLEVLEIIVTCLSAEDLSHCLGVSRTWYNIFSNDIFWKKHCMANSRDYFSKTKCLVEPVFKPPAETHLPVQGSRLQFLQEQHLWQNWNSGRFKKEEIEFDCDDSISYNIKVSFLDNDHVCLHRTFESEVWNVAETPYSVMTIPHCLKELWETNVYKVVENNLVVIQCNVVQVYKINLDSKSWCLNNVFFYNKPEEFSSSITGDTDVDGLFQLESISDETDFERIICGQYLVGAYMDEESPFLHIWNVNTGKKIKEDKCGIWRGSYYIQLTAPKEVTNKVLVTFKSRTGTCAEGSVERFCSIDYDLSRLQFILSTRQDHSGDVLYFDGCLSVVYISPLKIIRLLSRSTQNNTNIESRICLPDCIQCVTSIQPLGSNFLISAREQVFLINTSEVMSQTTENLSLMKVDFDISRLEVLFNRYTLLYDEQYESIKEIWKVGKSFRKVIEFPDDSGTYVASNNACSKIVLERGNKLIVLNFW